jgi:opacity protein-like surface antigen
MPHGHAAPGTLAGGAEREQSLPRGLHAQRSAATLSRSMRFAVVWLLIWSCGCAAGPSRRPVQQGQLAQADPDAGYASEFYAESGIALGLRAHGARLGGDFDGETTLDGPDTIFLSDTDDGTGYELVLSIQEEGTAFEFGYTRIEHEGDFAGFSGDVEYRAFGVRGINYWRANEALQPLAFVGMFYPLVDIEDGSSDGVATGTGKLRSGFGLELGGGLAWWLTPRLVLDLRVNTLYQEFAEAEGVGNDEEDIDDPVSAPSVGLSLGLTWVIRKKR